MVCEGGGDGGVGTEMYAAMTLKVRGRAKKSGVVEMGAAVVE